MLSDGLSSYLICPDPDHEPRRASNGVAARAATIVKLVRMPIATSGHPRICPSLFASILAISRTVCRRCARVVAVVHQRRRLQGRNAWPKRRVTGLFVVALLGGSGLWGSLLADCARG